MNSRAQYASARPGARASRASKGATRQKSADEHGCIEYLAINLYFDKRFESRAGKVLPGECYVTRRDTVLVPVLGSCLTTCIRDLDSGIRGINHFMLPKEAGPDVVSTSARYAREGVSQPMIPLRCASCSTCRCRKWMASLFSSA